MLVAHKMRIYPSKEQEAYLSKAFGVARFSFNHGLVRWKEALDKKEKTSWRELRDGFNSVKHVEFPWASEVSKHPSANAFENLGRAMKNFFAKRAKFPRFKKKGVRDSFRIDLSAEGTIKIIGKLFKIPKIPSIKMSEELRFDGEIKQVTVSRRAGMYFASFLIDAETNPYPQTASAEPVGVDLGLTSFVTLSDGQYVEPSHALKKKIRKLRRLSKNLSRKVMGSNNRRKAKTKLARLHYHVGCVRKDFLHKVSTHIARSYGKVCMESLNVSGMMGNRRLSRALADAGMYSFKVMMDYKCRWRGVELVLADRWFPSSKKCSACGNVKDRLGLSERTYRCHACGYAMDRDVNAAINLKELLLSA